MKRFFVLTAFLIFSFSTVLTSCTSSSLKIPGEDGVRVSSIYKEYFSIAQAYEEQKNYTKAVTYYKMAQNDKALKETAFYRTGRCYALSKDWDNALFYYNELLKKDPENTSLRLSVAYINAMKGELDAASKEYEALLADSVDAAVYKNYISVLIAQKNGEKASELLERFTADFPDDDSLKTLYEKLKPLLPEEEPAKADAGEEKQEKPASETAAPSDADAGSKSEKNQ